MKALVFHQHSDSLAVLQFDDVPKPTLQPGWALVKVRAVGLNHLDIWVRRGWPGLNLPLPHWSGSDIVGEIDGVSGECPYPLGTRVIVDPGFCTSDDEWTQRGEACVSPNYKIIGEHIAGGLAEYVAVPIANLEACPSHITDAQAAAFSLTGMTTWRMLFSRGNLKKGETILVVGSGGGVNSASIFLASQFGARVIALCGSPEKEERARQIGAAETICYKTDPMWHRAVLQITSGRGVDLVVDNVGAPTIQASLKAVRRGGRIVTVGNTGGPHCQIDNRLIFGKQIELIGSTMGNRSDLLSSVSQLWDGPIHLLIDSVQPFSQGIETLKRLEEGDHFGKLILAF